MVACHVKCNKILSSYNMGFLSLSYVNILKIIMCRFDFLLSYIVYMVYYRQYSGMVGSMWKLQTVSHNYLQYPRYISGSMGSIWEV